VVIEDSLASIPMSALPTIDGKNRFLLEEHTIRLVPSASFVASENPLPWSRTATAFADPIYNAADDRVRSGQPLRTGFQLNRLPASLTEAHSSMRTLSTLGWQTRIHSGSDSHPGNLRSAVLASRDVLHLAAHFSADPERPELLSVALSATDTGGVALFSAKDLTVLRTRTKLVALDGCTSAAGQTYAGLGIVGLSRAWIISGAQNVIGTIWPIEDSAGPFFPEFYARAAAHPYSSRAIAAALRQTQLQMMRRLDRYASPRYWAAYTLLQRS
jgi:CHAT domain-containing protein